MSTPYIPKVGDFFTIVRWTSHQDNSWVGACLEAKAVDGDIVLCVQHPQPNIFGRFTLVGSRCVFRPLSAEFVEEVCTNRQ